ncbi:MAG: hypothetical protein ACK58T_21650, partial [Phycisphaerae bacterium]
MVHHHRRTTVPSRNSGVLATRGGSALAGAFGVLLIASGALARDGPWEPLGSGLTGTGTSFGALATLTDGTVIAGGTFTSIGGVAANNIARWNGSSWQPLGSGVNSSVSALLALPDGSLIVGGGFTTAGGIAASRIARWDGSGWQALGPGLNDAVSVLTRLSDGTLVAGGTFSWSGGTPINRIAHWNGDAWKAFGTGL